MISPTTNTLAIQWARDKVSRRRPARVYAEAIAGELVYTWPAGTAGPSVRDLIEDANDNAPARVTEWSVEFDAGEGQAVLTVVEFDDDIKAPMGSFSGEDEG